MVIAGLTNVGHVKYRCAGVALALTSFLFHFSLFSDSLVWMSCKTSAQQLPRWATVCQQ